MTPEELEEEQRKKGYTPPPPVAPAPPGGGAGTAYGPGVSGPTNDPGPTPPPPPIQPYTSDSSAETLRAAANPEREGGGFNGTPLEETIYPPPPPPPATIDPGQLPTPPARTTVPPPVVAGRTTAAGVANNSEFTDLQRQAAAAIRATLSGQTPSLAQLQAREGSNRLVAQQLSAAAGARGRSVASANRVAQNNIGQLGVEQQAQAAQLRAQELAQARTELASLGTAGRGQDIQVATSDAELQLKAAISSDDREYGAGVENARNALAAVGLDDKYANEWMGNWLTLRGQNQTEKIAIMERDMRIWLANHPAAKDFWDKLASIGGLLGGGGEAVTSASTAGLI
jgi:hypothetical protein